MIPNLVDPASAAWTRLRDAEGADRSRRRGGLRVNLDRPWSATVYGEMLAAVLPPADFTGDPDTVPGAAYRTIVTQWGKDPVWEPPFAPEAALTASQFPLARHKPDPEGHWLPRGAPPDGRRLDFGEHFPLDGSDHRPEPAEIGPGARSGSHPKRVLRTVAGPSVSSERCHRRR